MAKLLKNISLEERLLPTINAIIEPVNQGQTTPIAFNPSYEQGQTTPTAFNPTYEQGQTTPTAFNPSYEQGQTTPVAFDPTYEQGGQLPKPFEPEIVQGSAVLQNLITPVEQGEGVIKIQPPAKQSVTAQLGIVGNAQEKTTAELRLGLRESLGANTVPQEYKIVNQLSATSRLTSTVNINFTDQMSLEDRLKQTNLGTTVSLPSFFLSDLYTDFIKIIPFDPVIVQGETTQLPFTFVPIQGETTQLPFTSVPIQGGTTILPFVYTPSQGVITANNIQQSIVQIPNFTFQPQLGGTTPLLPIQDISGLQGIIVQKNNTQQSYIQISNFTFQPVQGETQPTEISLTPIESQAAGLTQAYVPGFFLGAPPLLFKTQGITPEILLYEVDRAASRITPLLKHGGAIINTSPPKNRPGVGIDDNKLVYQPSLNGRIALIPNKLDPDADRTKENPADSTLYKQGGQGPEKRELPSSKIGEDAPKPPNPNQGVVGTPSNAQYDPEIKEIGKSVNNYKKSKNQLQFNEKGTTSILTTLTPLRVLTTPGPVNSTDGGENQAFSYQQVISFIGNRLTAGGYNQSSGVDGAGNEYGLAASGIRSYEEIARVANDPNDFTANPIRQAESEAQQKYQITNQTGDALNRSVEAESDDFVTLKFTSLRDGISLQFRSFLKSFNESFNASYEDVSYIGRPDKLKLYTGNSRGGSLGFMVIAMSEGEMQIMHTKLDRLAQIVYSAKYGSSGLYYEAPFINLTVGDYFKNMPVNISSLKYDMNPTEYSWETNYNGNIFQGPMMFDVALEFNVIGKTIPVYSQRLIDTAQ